MEGFGFLLLLVELPGQGLRTALVVVGRLLHVGGRVCVMVVMAVAGWKPVGTLTKATQSCGRWRWRLAVAPGSR